MKPYLKKERDYYLKDSIMKNLGAVFQALTGLSKSSQTLIEQELLINALTDSTNPAFSFAKVKASMQQRDTYHLMGALASKSLVVMKNVFEALIYVSFLFLIPLLFFPGMIRIFSTWLQMVLWVQMWPPFYAVLNFIMQTIAQGKAHNIFQGMGSETGLTIFTSIGIENLQADMFALAGYLSASIPFISYSLIKGGVSSFVHLATSMMTPGHSAATSAASEMITGNYSLGNVSYGNLNYGNSSLLQRNLAPSISGGFASETGGEGSTVYAGKEAYLTQRKSDLRTSLFSDNSIQNSLQEAQSHTESLSETQQSQYLESLQNHSRSLSSLTDHFAKNQNYSNSLSKGNELSLNESLNYFENLSEEMSKQYGWSHSDTKEYLFRAGANAGISLPIINIGASGSTETSTRSSESELQGNNAVLKTAAGESFQKHFQNLQRYAENTSFSSSDDMGNRLAKEHSQSTDQLHLYQQSLQTSLSKLDQISSASSAIESGSLSIKQNLTQDFIHWGSKKYENEGGFNFLKTVLNRDELDPEKYSLFQEYSRDVLSEKVLDLSQKNKHGTPFSEKYKNQSAWIENTIKSQPSTDFEGLVTETGLGKENIESKKTALINPLSSQFAKSKAKTVDKIHTHHEKLHDGIKNKKK